MTDHATEAFEIERKYEVREGSELPSADAFAAIGLFADAAETHELVARYFDTAERELSRRRLAVRERRGGKDAGWHLKEKGAEGARELLWPPSDRIPTELSAEIARHLGDERAVAPIAELHTTRLVLTLRDAAGAEVIELVDDLVRAFDHATAVPRAWREWEAELAPGADPTALDVLEPVLRAAGADPSPSPAKIARATGAIVAMALAAGATEEQIARLRDLDAADRAAAVREGM